MSIRGLFSQASKKQNPTCGCVLQVQWQPRGVHICGVGAADRIDDAQAARRLRLANSREHRRGLRVPREQLHESQVIEDLQACKRVGCSAGMYSVQLMAVM